MPRPLSRPVRIEILEERIAPAFAAVVELSALTGANGFKISGAAAYDDSGRSVSDAGDINGDGIDDLIIGARLADANGTDSGASYVVFGNPGGFASNLNLSALNGVNGFKIGGVRGNGQFGISVSAAGDINGDGIDDLIISGHLIDANDAGASYVVFGSRSSFASNLNLSVLTGTNGFKISGVAAFDQSGRSVSGAGDINGDGIDDLLIGAIGVASNGSYTGASYVVFGKRSGFAPNLNLSALNGTNGFKISGEAANDYSGRSVSAAGDINGDGIDDLIIGANGADPNGSKSGASYVVFGSRSAFASSFDLSALNGTNGFKINGVATFDGSGYSVSAAGDINGDGIDDLLIGAYFADTNGNTNSGATYVVFGSRSAFASSFDLSALNGTNGFKVSGGAAFAYSGFSVSAAGDINGDGIDDFLTGARRADTNSKPLTGASYVIFGSHSAFASNLNLTALNGANGFKINGVAAFDYSGRSVSAAGDINGDGIDDLLIGAPGADPNSIDLSGATYVLFGQPAVAPTPFSANLNLSALTGTNGFKLSGAAINDRSGISVSDAGDINGDGIDDLLIGAPSADPNGNYTGASYVVFGSGTPFAGNLNLSGLTGGNGFKISGVVGSDFSGISVSAAGDINGDGIDDLAIGTSPIGSSSGVSYVVFGSRTAFAANLNLSALTGANGFKISGVATDDAAGRSVSAAGDINGDGIDDLLIGAYQTDPNGSLSGASYVVFGKRTAFAANLNLSGLTGGNGFKISGVTTNDFSGRSVSAAGDINGDGIDDLLIGASGADSNGNSDSGATYVVFGSRTPFAANLNLAALGGANGFKISGVAADDSSGWAVSSAGDINGDGIDDLLIGAYEADPHGTNSGASYVVFGSRTPFAGNLNLSALTGANGFKISGVAGNDRSGFSVSDAGDINGDGIDDLLIGARYADPNGTNSGASYVVFGSRSGFAANLELSALTGTNGFKVSGSVAYDQSGRTVSAAGDINGDGIDDLLVGAPYANPVGSMGAGVSYVVFGHRAPAVSAPSLHVTLTGGNLTLADTDATGRNNALTIKLINGGASLELTDAVETFDGVPATTPASTLSNGGRTLTIPFSAVTGSLTLNTLGGTDTVTLDLSGGDFINAGGIDFNGGNPTVAPGDKLVISGGAQGTVTYNYTNAANGNIVMSNFGTVRYTGLEPITNTGTATDLIFNLTSGLDQAVLEDAAGAGTLQLRSANSTFELTTFNNPSGSVTINTGGGADTLTVSAIADLTSTLTLGSAANPFSTVSFTGAVALGAASTLSAFASTTISNTAAGTISAGGDMTLTAGTDITISGNITKSAGADATLAIRANNNIEVAAGADVTSTSNKLHVILNSNRDATGAGAIRLTNGTVITSNGGDITFGGGANPATTATLGNSGLVAGINILNSTLNSGSGAISLRGQGPALAGGFGNLGVQLTAATILQSTTGNITVFGQGGTLGSGSDGVALNGQITSSSGNIDLTGIAGSHTGISGSNGVVLGSAGSAITTAGAGTITINGTGGVGNASFDCGVNLAADSIVQVANGALTINGTATNGTSAGVRLGQTPGGRVVSTGNGSIAITATGPYGFEALGTSFVGGPLATGSITISGNRIDLSSTTPSIQTTGTVTLKQKDNGTLINLGGADATGSPATLGLTNAELSRITAGTLQIGDSNSGPITINAVISPTNYKTLAFGNAVSFSATGGFNSDVTSATVFEKITAAGAVSIHPSAMLTVTAQGGFVPAGADSFTIINNTSASTTTGTFSGKPEGSTVALGGVNETITYIGGTGNDVVLQRTVSVAIGTTPVLESSSTGLVYTFTRNGNLSAGLPINFTKGGTALFTTDFTASSTATVFNYSAGTLTIPAGASSVTVTLVAVDDRLVEGSETAMLTVASGSGYAPIGLPATGTFTDNDTATVALSAPGTTAAEGGGLGAALLTLALNTTGTLGTAQLANAVTVNVTDLGTGTAASGGTDYTFTAGTAVTFASGATDGATQTASFASINDDFFVEGTETVNLSVAIGSGPATISGSTTLTSNINDNDTATWSLTGGSGATEGTNASYTISLAGILQNAETATINVALNDSTATSADHGALTTAINAAIGARTDLSFNGTTLTYTGNGSAMTALTFTIAATDDTLVEGDESFSVAISTPGSTTGASVAGTGSVSTTIADNDTATWSLSGSNSATEGTDASYTISLAGTLQSGETATTAVSLTNVTTTSADHGALAAAINAAIGARTDLSFDGTTFTYTGNGSAMTALTFTIAASDDTLVEGSENFTVAISSPGSTTGASVAGAGSVGTTITDNDTASLAIQTTRTITEQGGGQTVTVTLTTSDGAGGTATLAPGITLTADVVDAGGGTAASGTDYTAFGTQTVTFGAGSAHLATQTVTFTTINDQFVEGSETANLTLQNLNSTLDGQASLGNSGSVITITDNDTATVAISAPAVTATEGGSLSAALLTLTLNTDGTGPAELANAVTVHLSDLANGTATAGADYTFKTPTAVAFAIGVGSSRVDLQACKLEYSIVSPK